MSLIVVTKLLGKVDESNRFMSQLRSTQPLHPYLRRVDGLEEDFERAMTQFA